MIAEQQFQSLWGVLSREESFIWRTSLEESLGTKENLNPSEICANLPEGLHRKRIDEMKGSVGLLDL